MKGSQYKPNKINRNILKLMLFALAATVASTSIAEVKDESSLTAYAWTPETHLSEEPVNDYIDPGFGNNVNIYNGEAADLVLFFAGNATKLKDNHLGISLCLSW
ncbi:MAG: hypothetical protein KAT61_03545 [Gammaproteobacteria bacterium]|nr:hypothetical protein [Gammaproteobacteria bacterium]